jgi:predicted ATPase
MRLIERESQLAALAQYADEASHAQGRLVLISGEAGIGKIRATRALCSAVGGCSLALGGM